MTFVAWPAWSMPTETTTACVGSVRLLTICCSAEHRLAERGHGVGRQLGVSGVPGGALDR